MKRFVTICMTIGFTLILMGCSKANPNAAKVSSNPPKIGEVIDDVVDRLGPPESNDFESQRNSPKYITSYTDKAGTIHHVTVEDGIITRVLYTDSR